MKSFKIWYQTAFKKSLRREVVTTLIILGGIFAFKSTVVEPYTVPTGSMEPTIQPGDYLFVLKSAYDVKLPFTDISLIHVKEPERGDIIVFKYPQNPSVRYIKRLIGLPGDEIAVRNGLIQVNGKEIPQSFQISQAKGDESVEFFGEQLGDAHYTVQRLPYQRTNEALQFRVPQNSYFFMGDNRDASNDSRYWGFVPKDYLKGKALFVWLSLNSKDHWIPWIPWIPSIRWDRFGKKLL